MADAGERFLLAGVMGWPAMHSRSPVLHGHWLDVYGVRGAYVPLEIRPDRFEAALRALPALTFRGCNLTMPHKEMALSLLDEVDDTARAIGAVNTVTVEPDGRLAGTNTDAFGFLASLDAAAPGWDPGPAVVLGAGGAARAVVHALKTRGVTEIRLLNRTRARAEALAEALGGPVSVLDWEARDDALEGAALLVNSTNQGMKGEPPLDLDLAPLPRAAIVVDIVYYPLETPLLAAARARGNRLVDGLGMLLHQARPCWRSWLGIDPEVTGALRREVEATF